MGLNRSNLTNSIKDLQQEDDLITIKKKVSKKGKGKKRGRGNENNSLVRRAQKSSRPAVEPTPTTRTANRNVFGTGSID